MKLTGDSDAFAAVGAAAEETMTLSIGVKAAVRQRRDIRPPRKMPKRSCRLCGKDSSPNYFFCPSCHHRITSGDAEDEA